MKKCPVCGSFSADEDSTCGVCANSIRDVDPIHGDVETVELADQAARQVEDRKRATRQLGRMLAKMTAGLAVGVGMVVYAVAALMSNGFGSLDIALASLLLLLPFGICIVAYVLLGGLGSGSLNEYVRFRSRWARLIVQLVPPEDEVAKEKEREQND